MASDRDTILQSLRDSQAAASGDLPQVRIRPEVYADPVAHFSIAVESVGGRCLRGSREERVALIGQVIESTAARQVRWEQLPGDTGGTLGAVESPQSLAGVDLLVAGGRFAVAENGAVWVDDGCLTERAGLFLAQHLVLVVRLEDVVNDMHQAYERLQSADFGYGVFISGPSKTADIEQALVIGAHGPRSLTVVLES